ncbi:hypothetical protein [Streptomyces sp. ISL-11]|uniref:hypothetical protein n=1 Tax=Streptomyces sp. ISL-11 TaxID=2819174 RepID=UPI001BE8E904|nr:hypothetical protein [Streptomyces sp. ISL-11]MBT2385019.1 hypothetical protein [Streptomyces sp. ISL-11]
MLPETTPVIRAETSTFGDGEETSGDELERDGPGATEPPPEEVGDGGEDVDVDGDVDGGAGGGSPPPVPAGANGPA